MLVEAEMAGGGEREDVAFLVDASLLLGLGRLLLGSSLLLLRLEQRGE